MQSPCSSDVFVRSWKTSHLLPDEGKLALFDEEKSELILLNPIGGAVWSKLDGQRTVNKIALELVEQSMDAPSHELATTQIISLLEELLVRQAISRNPGV